MGFLQEGQGLKIELLQFGGPREIGSSVELNLWLESYERCPHAEYKLATPRSMRDL